MEGYADNTAGLFQFKFVGDSFCAPKFCEPWDSTNMQRHSKSSIKTYLDLNFGREQLSRFLVFCQGSRSRGSQRLVIDDILFLRWKILWNYTKPPPYHHQVTLQSRSPARIMVFHDLAEALGAPTAIKKLFFLLKKRGPGKSSIRPITLEDPVVPKNRVVKAMADRCLAG